MKLKINYNDDNLYCIYSKELIIIGEKYIEIEEEYQGSIINKIYKIDYAPIDEDEEPYIGE